MTVNLTKIGNSKGIRIPKPLIDECGLGDRVELRVEKGRPVILPEGPVRPAPLLLGDGIANDFDREEWEW
jgi:antitoxin MazE